ncbi:hypothetical protein [Roseicitreum antarcticum]|uniref:Uncharacterized protein n=1 Tax=Roseicitreum antarcticum TaxID=564137 RepID=A0A1H3FPD2_9RHOB|nr:hypothetical protein [Roseicitreum antarcticum]SDX92912.1 hypothetical protein SAMN04488238_1453 [Roseicitreum antarcticum]
MKKLVIIAAALISAGAATAQSVSPGHEQFAAGLNLDATQYTMPELINIEQARQDNNRQTERFYLEGTNRQSRGGVGEVSPGKAQFAAPLGVNAADYTMNELIALSVAQREDDAQTEAFIRSKQNRQSYGNVSEVSRGKAQFANGLGVNAADYSLNELVALSVKRHSDDN